MECLSPAAIADATVKTGKKKAGLKVPQLVILGLLAGVYIGFGSQLFILVTSDLAKYVGFGLSKLIGGLVFSTGLVLVVLAGAELFTGNSLVIMAACSRQISWKQLLRNWLWVYVSNFAGSLLLVFLLFGAHQYALGDNVVGASALKIAVAKVNIPFWSAFFRGILCNWLVCLAVWMATGATDTAGKIGAIVFPVTAFVASGFEHSVANMFFIPMGLLVKNVPSVVQTAGSLPGLDHLTWGTGLFLRNLLPVTMGNIVGGALFVGCLYWAAYLFPAAHPSR